LGSNPAHGRAIRCAFGRLAGRPGRRHLEAAFP